MTTAVSKGEAQVGSIYLLSRPMMLLAIEGIPPDQRKTAADHDRRVWITININPAEKSAAAHETWKIVPGGGIGLDHG
jgi:hypothetical protein